MNNIPAALIELFWVLFLLYWLLSSFNSKAYVRRNYVSWGVRLLIVVIVYLLYSVPAVGSYLVATEKAVPYWLQWTGVALSACGILFAIWARVNLGRNWGTPMSLKKDAELVTSGPYAYVRHPIYSGFLLGALGSCFVSIWWVIPLLLLFVYFVYSAKTEEKIMTNEFPAAYPDYMKRTKMLIPFVF